MHSSSYDVENCLVLADRLSLEELRRVEEHVSNKIQTLTNHAMIESNLVIYNKAVAEWFRLAQLKLPSYGQIHTHSYKCYKDALVKAFSELGDEYKWTGDVIESDHHNKVSVFCDEDECWYKRHLERFHGVTEVEVSVFCDVHIGDPMTLCDVCCENGLKENFEVDVSMYVGEFQKWLGLEEDGEESHDETNSS
jgi:hypothetical protein